MPLFTRRTKSSPGTARRKHRLELFKKWGALSILALSLLGALLYGAHRPEWRIREVSVEGANVIKEDEIKSIAWRELSGKYLYLIPRDNILFYPKNKIEIELRNNFQRIEELSINRSGFSKLIIKISERPKRYLWCGVEVIAQRNSSDKCFFADSGGVIFSEAPYYSGNLFLEFYGKLEGGESGNPISGSILPEGEFIRISELHNALARIGLSVVKILIGTDGDYEMFLEPVGKLLVNNKNNYIENLDDLEVSLATDPLKGRMEKERMKLDYLDIRFGNKVFYKFK